MKHLILAAALLMSATMHLHAQVNGETLTEEERNKIREAAMARPSDTLWTFGGSVGLNFNQSYFSNWASGGQNSVALTGLTSLFAKYHKDRNSWETTLDLAYGILSQDDGDPIKTDDRIDLTSKYGYALKNPHWFLSALFNFKTQFAKGYIIEDGKEVGKFTSNFMAPAYSIASLGIDYKPNDYFSAFISPATAKMTIVNEDRLAIDYGLDPGDNFRMEIGAFAKITYRRDIFENVNLDTRLDLFSNYSENPQNVDVNWQTLITMKINNWLSTTLTTQLIYDDDVVIGATDAVLAEDGSVITPGTLGGPRTQFREVFALGISYKF